MTLTPIRLSDRAVVGAEALVRWEHPQLGLLPPDQFIALAERSGLIQALARWVLTAALRQSARWRSAGLDVPVSVNLSAANLRDTLLPGEIERLLTTYKTPPGGLTLELTENAVMTDPTEAAQALGRLRRLGVRIALDDFGIGQSSLTWLHRLPVDEIKIDRSFVLEMAGDEHGAAIARLTAETGHRFGLRVTAEGVDNADTLELLHGLGCDAAQGYVICPPLPAAELEDWLRRRR
ncbi:MAG: EAL domain-containing protein [Chloroflexi bacterium]|nr:EAL domain-containing protein [Chloroflexota bacterium]